MTAIWSPPRVKTSERPMETPSAKNSTVPVAGQGADVPTVAVKMGGRVVIESRPDEATRRGRGRRRHGMRDERGARRRRRRSRIARGHVRFPTKSSDVVRVAVPEALRATVPRTREEDVPGTPIRELDVTCGNAQWRGRGRCEGDGVASHRRVGGRRQRHRGGDDGHLWSVGDRDVLRHREHHRRRHGHAYR